MRKPLGEEAVRGRIRDYDMKADTWVHESRLCRDLRSLPEEARFRILKDLHAVNFPRALILVYWCIDSLDYCETFLRDGLLTADPQSIRLYVRHLAPKLDWQYFFRVLEEMLATYPEGVRRAVYFVRRESFGEHLPDDEWQQVTGRVRAIQSDERYIVACRLISPPDVWQGTEIKRDPGVTPLYRRNQRARFGEAREMQYRRVIRPK
ncbi:MAG: hypothetical protein H7145_07675 [Akkermansiaceae bacterium]|nr:hypothetical protein [Armatimonadota bacterium]